MKKSNKMRFKSLLLTPLMMVMMLAPITTKAAQPTVNLGTSSTFAVLAGSAITIAKENGPTIINGSIGGEVDGNVGGDVGLAPGTSFSGQENATVSGTVHVADAAAAKAKEDLKTAYGDAAGRNPVTTIPTELGGRTLKPGVYDSASGTFGITGTLTLDAEGDPNAVFIFKAASTLITASSSEVKLINSARFCRTFWQVGSSATLGTDSHFVGHIFAMESITATKGATIQGQLLARDGAVTLDNNTITNGYCETIAPPTTPDKATLHVIKHVVNDDGGTKVAADFKLNVKNSVSDKVVASAPGAEAPGNTYTVDAGNYVINEDDFTGYTQSYSEGIDGSGNITLAPGDNKTITITNNDIAVPTPPAKATLKVIKKVVNDDGGTKVPADFSLHVKASDKDVAQSPAPGTEAGKIYTLDAGNYVISEDDFTGYKQSYSGDSDASGNITLKPGDNKTITITNNDDIVVPKPPAKATLKVIKHVINDDGRTSVAANFKLNVKNLVSGVVVANAPGEEDPGNTYTLDAGTYVIGEDDFTGYTQSYSVDSDASGKITLAPGENKTVIITNNDIAITPTPPTPVPTKATLHVIKHVVNDDGGESVAAKFNLKVKNVVSGDVVESAPGEEAPGTTYTLDAGTYVITEDAFSGYTASYSGNSDASGNITLAPGDNKTITITNNDIAAAPIVSGDSQGTKPVVTAPVDTVDNVQAVENEQAVVTSTVTGGQLPETSTRLYNLLLLGVVLTIGGVLGLRNKKRYE